MNRTVPLTGAEHSLADFIRLSVGHLFKALSLSRSYRVHPLPKVARLSLSNVNKSIGNQQLGYYSPPPPRISTPNPIAYTRIAAARTTSSHLDFLKYVASYQVLVNVTDSRPLREVPPLRNSP